ncbi:nucleoside diphosphate-linked moiety X motif 13 isoform X3 [Amphiprion ocellaris]|uniref:nucleoside diphosphate-linked moiety X motif 13 isoform X3 n=1 Tax=Amphiprion ocellaris TaxID=80972 RepID=UPI00241163CF|nr:nucleoside diphosphate-linked moiety X motif 13 isoform X3 [Amphiprion ocellaris]
MLRPLRILLSPPKCPLTRCCSGYVSRMRFVNRLQEDDDACAAALQNGRIFLFHSLSPLLQRTNRGTFRTSALTASGQLDQAAVEEQCGGTFVDLRKAFFLLKGAEAPLVAKGQALLRWHQTNRFCSATGQPTQRNQAGSHRFCSSSSTTYYPQMSPVVIVLVSDGTRCLLGRQASFPRGLYSALAGFCNMGETLEEALRREVAEEVGLEVQNISYSSSQHWPFPHSSFMVACHASVSPTHSQVDVDHSELEEARWFSLDEITCALQVKAPPRRGDPPVIWLPPPHAVANRLITEWADLQRHGKDGP